MAASFRNQYLISSGFKVKLLGLIFSYRNDGVIVINAPLSPSNIGVIRGTSITLLFLITGDGTLIKGNLWKLLKFLSILGFFRNHSFTTKEISGEFY